MAYLVLDVCLIALASIVSLPCAVVLVECVAALFRLPRATAARSGDRPRVAVLVPAHDEEGILGATLRALRRDIGPRDRLIAIADNCTDGTARIAEAAGATVIERHDPQHRGKGFALAFGLRHLASDPPDVVIVLDADCTASPGAIGLLARHAVATGRPVQAAYAMNLPSRPSPRDVVSALAFTLKNVVRPRGLAALGGPSPLTGSGMALPWSVIPHARFDGDIVEDLKLGIDLTLAGHSPLFCGNARVVSRLPREPKAARIQRTRWEHGHLHTLFTQVPRLLGAARDARRLMPLAMALDLAVPPLSLLVLTLFAVLGLTILCAEAGATWAAAWMVASAMASLGLGVTLGWARFGRPHLPFSSLLTAPAYVIWKMPIYLALVRRRQTEWVRTERDDLAPRVPMEKH